MFNGNPRYRVKKRSNIDELLTTAKKLKCSKLLQKSITKITFNRLHEIIVFTVSLD